MMEVYKRIVGYQDFNYRAVDSSLPITASSYVITATTLYFPIMLTQNFEDIGIYTDVENPTYQLSDYFGKWNLSNNGSSQRPCLPTNNCTVNFSSTPITFYNGNDGSVTATVGNCVASTTVQWTGPNGFNRTDTLINNSITISNLISGNYTIKVTDNNCDFKYFNYYVEQPPAFSITNIQSTNSQINATVGCNGTIGVTVVGGRPPYSYLWYAGGVITNVIPGTTSSSTSATNLCAGDYAVQVTDADNHIVSAYFVVTEPEPLTANTVYTVNINCYGGNTGEISLLASGGSPVPGGYTFTLSNGTNTYTINGSTGPATFENLSAGNYSVVVNDSPGNFVTINNIQLIQPTFITTTIVGYTNTTCYSSNPEDLNGSGTITIQVNGGNPQYYLIIKRNGSDTYPTIQNNSVNNFTIKDLTEGNYSIVVQDNNGCQAQAVTQTITQPTELLVTITTIPATPCSPACTSPNVGPCVQAVATVSGGVGGYTYLWKMEPGGVSWGTTNTSNPFCTGMDSYNQITVKVTDANGCIKTESISV